MYTRNAWPPVVHPVDMRAMKDENNQKYCSDPANIYCCESYTPGSGINVFADKCEQAIKYKTNRAEPGEGQTTEEHQGDQTKAHLSHRKGNVRSNQKKSRVVVPSLRPVEAPPRGPIVPGSFPGGILDPQNRM